MNAKIDKFKERYTQLLVADATNIQRIKDGMTQDIQNITMLSKRIEGEKLTHAIQYRSIQMAGITLITSIVMIFILKMFGFTDIIKNVIAYPFVKLFSKN
jgi:hypothetical protein